MGSRCSVVSSCISCEADRQCNPYSCISSMLPFPHFSIERSSAEQSLDGRINESPSRPRHRKGVICSLPVLVQGRARVSGPESKAS